MSKNGVRNRFVSGASGGVGYIAKKPGHGVETEQFIEQRKAADFEKLIIERTLNKMKTDETMRRFWTLSDYRAIESEINRRAELGLRAYDESLEDKRNRLRTAMLNEASSLTVEYVKKAQLSVDRAFEAKQKLVEEIQSQQVDEEATYVQKCYERMFNENCDEYRTQIQKENRKALNAAHLRQMEEKSMAAQIEKDEEQVWIDFEDEEDQRRLLRVQNESSQRESQSANYLKVLNAQIEDTEKRKRDELIVERLEELKREKIREAAELEQREREVDVKREQLRYKDDFSKQAEWNRVTKERIKNEEIAFDKIMIDYDMKQLEKEKAAVFDTREQRRSELHAFQTSVKKYKESALASRIYEDEAIEKQRKLYECRKLQQLRKEAKARADLLNSCKDARKKQIEDRKNKERAAKDAEALDAEFLKFRIDHDEPLDLPLIAPLSTSAAASKLTAQVLEKENKENERYAGMLQKRVQMEEKEFADLMRSDEQELNRKIADLLKGTAEGFSTSKHPFLIPLMLGKNKC